MKMQIPWQFYIVKKDHTALSKAKGSHKIWVCNDHNNDHFCTDWGILAFEWDIYSSTDLWASCVFLNVYTLVFLDLTVHSAWPSHHTAVFHCSSVFLSLYFYPYFSIHSFTGSLQLYSLAHTHAWLESHCDFLNHRLLAVVRPAFPVPLSALYPCFHLFTSFSPWIILVMYLILCKERIWSLRGDVLWHTFSNHQSVCHSTSTQISSRLETANVYCRHNHLQSVAARLYTVKTDVMQNGD